MAEQYIQDLMRQYGGNVKPGTMPTADQYKPNQTILDVESQIRQLLANPQTNPEDVQKWQDWLNKQNMGADKQAQTRLQEQFSSLGDLGSSANREAMAGADVTRQLGRSQQALDLTQQAAQQKRGDINSLMGVGTTEQNLSLIPLSQQFQNYEQGQNQLGNINLAGLQQEFTSKNQQDMVDFYNQNKPKTNWWDPLVNAAATGVGYSLGGPLGGMIGNGVSNLFSSQNSNPSMGSPLNLLGTTNQLGSGFGSSPSSPFYNMNMGNVGPTTGNANSLRSFQP